MLSITETIAGKTIESISVRLCKSDDNEPDWIEAIYFQITNQKFVISVVPDSDELKIEDISNYQSNSGITKIENNHALADLLNKKIIWVWTLTNNQGYLDGLQIEVENNHDSIIFQFMALASQIKIFKLQSL